MTGAIIAGFGIGLTAVAILARVCRISLRKVPGKTRPGLRRFLPTWVLLALGGRVKVPADGEQLDAGEEITWFRLQSAAASPATAAWVDDDEKALEARLREQAPKRKAAEAELWKQLARRRRAA